MCFLLESGFGTKKWVSKPQENMLEMANNFLVFFSAGVRFVRFLNSTLDASCVILVPTSTAGVWSFVLGVDAQRAEFKINAIVMEIL